MDMGRTLSRSGRFLYEQERSELNRPTQAADLLARKE